MKARRSILIGMVLPCALLGALTAMPTVAVAAECPNAAFRTGPSTHLPDCRAYEMVTPPFKDAGFARLLALNASGLAAELAVNGAFGGVEGYPNIVFPLPGVRYTTQRTDSGWVTTPVELSSSEYLPFNLQGFDDWGGVAEEGPDTQAIVWMARKIGQPENSISFFKRRSDRSIAEIGPALPPTTPPGVPSDIGEELSGLRPIGLSPNSSRYFFMLHQENYWPFDGTQARLPTLYEYVGTGNTTPLLVGVDNSGNQIGQCGTLLGAGNRAPRHNGVSADGNTVFFTVSPAHQQIAGGEKCERSAPPVAEVFARIDSGLPGAHTVAISEPSKADCSACDTEAGVLAGAQFQSASADGSKVFFTTTQPLLGGDTNENIYEYDFDAPAGERVFRVSRGDSTVSSPAPGLVQIDGASPLSSEDGSHVYFIATGVLTRIANGEGESAEVGANNLYVAERDARYPAGHIAFIARLSERDRAVNVPGIHWEPDLTPDGRFLVFASERDLTPDDTSVGVRQIFEYDAQTGLLVRVSVGQDGFNHNGNVTERKLNVYSGVTNDAKVFSPVLLFTEYAPLAYSTRSTMSADGSYVFFQSTVGLTPQALDQQVIGKGSTGGPVYANNVYEYHEGRVSLISDGEDITRAGNVGVVELLGTDASGQDVFFQTADRLVGQDTDTNLDIYDARIGGGFPAPAPTPSCSGDACQGALSAAPELLSPGSEFQAGSNPPLAGAPATKPAPKQKAKKQKKVRKKRRRAKGGEAGGWRGSKANGAALGGRANRKAGRS